MNILVVKTCDGDVYYRAGAKGARKKAMELAVNQVLFNDSANYDSEDRQKIKDVQKEVYARSDSRAWQKLMGALVDCGVIRTDWVHDGS